MPNAVAGATRPARYSQCAVFFAREVAALRPRALIAVGGEVYRRLTERQGAGDPPVFKVMHYSQVAAPHRKRLLAPDWRNSVPTRQEMDEFIEARRYTSVSATPVRPVTNSHLELLGAYRVQLDEIRFALGGSLHERKSP